MQWLILHKFPLKPILKKVIGKKFEKRIIHFINKRNLKRVKISADDRLFLKDVFKEDLSDLSKLFNVDKLPLWLKDKI